MGLAQGSLPRDESNSLRELLNLKMRQKESPHGYGDRVLDLCRRAGRQDSFCLDLHTREVIPCSSLGLEVRGSRRRACSESELPQTNSQAATGTCAQC